MSTVIEELLVDRSRHWTLEELDALPRDGRRREILDGILYVSPMPRRKHQRVLGEVFYHFRQWEGLHGGQAYVAGLEVDLVDGSHLEPDVAFLVPGREVTADVRSLIDAPDLVVEVSSPSTKRYDAGLKRERYAAHGVREYWIVDLDAEAVLVYRGGVGTPDRHKRGTAFSSVLLPGLVLDVDDLLDA